MASSGDPSLFWLLGHQSHTLNLNTTARCLLLVTKIWSPCMSEALLLPYTACCGFPVIWGGSAPLGEDTL